MSRSWRADLPIVAGNPWKSTVVTCNMMRHEIGQSLALADRYVIDLFVEMSGWGTWIRTRTNGVRVRGSTVNLFPSRRGNRAKLTAMRRCGCLVAAAGK